MSIDTLFNQCSQAAELLGGDVSSRRRARELLIGLLSDIKTAGQPVPQILNHLLRVSGLYPYINGNLQWEDAVAKELFYQDCGEPELSCLHLEQSKLLAMLAAGDSLVVSAPTSFGKSYVVDALIRLKHPKDVMVIVPTIALTDETRRRMHRKFSNEYKIITTCDVKLDDRDKRIFIFPQERAVSYYGKIANLDLLVIDEFYKSSAEFDRERSPLLLDVLIKFKPISKQCYCLAPNIDSYEATLFTQGMRFVRFTLPTVILSTVDKTDQIGGDPIKKSLALLGILHERINSKTLIYVGNFTEMGIVVDLVRKEFGAKLDGRSNSRAVQFSQWLKSNYSDCWVLPDLVAAGAGMHSSRMHRSLAQIQLRLFDEKDGLSFILSTSSIVEGVNTTAENVVIWSKKNGHPDLDRFTYKNICGRAGRMFHYFIGNVFVLEKPKFKKKDYNLKLGIADKDVNMFQEEGSTVYLTDDQRSAVEEFKSEWVANIGEAAYNAIFRDCKITKIPHKRIKEVISGLSSATQVEALRGLLSDDVREFSGALLVLFKLVKPFVDLGPYDPNYKTVRRFICLLRYNWKHPVRRILDAARSKLNVEVEDFFRIEKWVVHDFSKLIQEIDVVQKTMSPSVGLDLQPFVGKLTNSFLPPLVFQLEEYGLPRMFPQRIQEKGLVDFEDGNLTLELVEKLLISNKDDVMSMEGWTEFDLYILKYFYEGIE